MVPSGLAFFLASALLVSLLNSGLATTQGYYSHAVIESCRGCQLNRLPDIKAFIFEDIPLYEKVEFKHIQGAPPELVLFNEHEQEVERLKLAQLTRKECNDLLVGKGFGKSVVKDEM